MRSEALPLLFQLLSALATGDHLQPCSQPFSPIDVIHLPLCCIAQHLWKNATLVTRVTRRGSGGHPPDRQICQACQAMHEAVQREQLCIGSHLIGLLQVGELRSSMGFESWIGVFVWMVCLCQLPESPFDIVIRGVSRRV